MGTAKGSKSKRSDPEDNFPEKKKTRIIDLVVKKEVASKETILTIDFNSEGVPIVPDGLETDCLWELHGLQPPKSKQSARVRTQEFFLFMSERQRIFVRRQRGDPVWTASPVFQYYSWCNVYRELDRGTQYFRARVLKIIADRPSKQARLKMIFFSSFVYRLSNRIESFNITGFPDPDLESVNKYLEKVTEIQQANKPQQKFFTGAHQTTNFRNLADYIRTTVQKLDSIVQRISEAQDAAAVCKILRSLPGIDRFYAWQILCDLKESKCIHLKEDMFCVLGPGAEAGLKMIFGDKQANNKSNPLLLAQELVKAHKSAYKKLGVEFPYWNGRALSIKEIEHALCEYAKFRKVTDPSISNGRTRIYKSRSCLDEDQPCATCGCSTDDHCYMCDTCNQAFCTRCIEEAPEGVYWSCGCCKDLDELRS